MNSAQKLTMLKKKKFRIWKTSEKRMKQKCKKNERLLQQTRRSRR
jgi:hypothetical protein